MGKSRTAVSETAVSQLSITPGNLPVESGNVSYFLYAVRQRLECQ